jgi:methylenetetrahydrofolate--tRNA-(uracil-5-)-methyltransferase
MSKDEYYQFVDELLLAERISLHDFESNISVGVKAGAEKYFEGCLPVEIIAERAKDALAYGPMRPVGLTDPRTGKHAYAVVQLRQDNLAKTSYNLVGFQTNLKYSEQERVFRMIPGLGQAEFARFGQMHRNTFIFSPALLKPTLQYSKREDLFFAGQITGVEGYMGNIATGYLAGLNAVHFIQGQPMLVMPHTTIIGALVYYITHAAARDFQPMKANFGIMPELALKLKTRRDRAAAYAERSKSTLLQFISEHSDLFNNGNCA